MTSLNIFLIPYNWSNFSLQYGSMLHDTVNVYIPVNSNYTIIICCIVLTVCALFFILDLISFFIHHTLKFMSSFLCWPIN